MCKSAFSLCIFSILASLKKVCVIVVRRMLFNLCMAENVRSAVADITGIVRDMLTNFTYLLSILFMMSQIVLWSSWFTDLQVLVPFLGAPCAPPVQKTGGGGGGGGGGLCPPGPPLPAPMLALVDRLSTATGGPGKVDLHAVLARCLGNTLSLLQHQSTGLHLKRSTGNC